MFFGLHSSFIHLVSVFSSSVELSSVVRLAILLAIKIPTPPPDLFFLFFPIHLYLLMLADSLLLSLDFVIRAMSTFSASRRVCKLLIFPLIPLVFMLAIVRFLFFLILGLLVFLFTWSLPGEVMAVVLVSAGLGSVGLIGSLGLYIFVLVGPNFTSLFCPVLGVLWFLLLYLLLLLFFCFLASCSVLLLVFLS